ncbi:alpha/beta hydrolase [Actinomadura darangshiensis]|uniref:Alpha/beta hydrolase n=1 Tax=Actinomadura darangshiensis TaxID=705336 RepID=A0A4R5BC49_9ACTN|nr:alpha/beta hydrolase [Actinomadura darangshiensis]TDD82266.1 alpha/beta hydrolase [Actinomadura darangshiensis]
MPVGTTALAAIGLLSLAGVTDHPREVDGVPRAAVGTLPAAAGPIGTPSGAAGASPAAAPPLDWMRCTGLPEPPPGSKPPAGGFRCATLKVPLDYAKPSGEKIGLALIKAPATDRKHRIGSLVFNFGGPGGDGVGTFAQAAGQYATLGTRYDLVSFDPRGVGRSSPVTCADGPSMDRFTAMDDSPDTAAEEKTYLDGRAGYVRQCAARSGRLLPHVGTVDAARDLDMIRAALGDEKLHYFGISYGTWLGGNYAHQFPGRVGRAVLDGAVDTRISALDLALQQAAGFQSALGDFGAACARLGTKACPLGKDGPSVVASTGRILAGLDRTPLSTSSGRKLTQSLGTTGVAAALYSQNAWPYLAQGLVDAVKRRDGTLLLMLADVQNGRMENGAYSNLTAANTAITCADGTDRYTAADVRRLLPKFRGASPIFGTPMAWGLLQCTGWPVKGDDAAREVSAPSAAPILVVGNTGDPATPYAWAPALTKALGGRATLLTLKGEGHGAYDTGDSCVHEAVDAYLLTGTTPLTGATCG